MPRKSPEERLAEIRKQQQLLEEKAKALQDSLNEKKS